MWWGRGRVGMCVSTVKRPRQPNEVRWSGEKLRWSVELTASWPLHTTVTGRDDNCHHKVTKAVTAKSPVATASSHHSSSNIQQNTPSEKDKTRGAEHTTTTTIDTGPKWILETQTQSWRAIKYLLVRGLLDFVRGLFGLSCTHFSVKSWCNKY